MAEFELLNTAPLALHRFREGLKKDPRLSTSSEVRKFEKFVGALDFTKQRDAGSLVIVVEGLDGTGKTTLAKSLANRLGAKYVKTPMLDLTPVRALFDDPATDPTTSKAFYYLSNYLAAEQEIKRYLTPDLNVSLFSSANSPCVVDRFYYSTLCYALGQSDRIGLQDCPAEIWDWPVDLLLPTVILLLDLPEDERQKRLRERNSEFTINEELLEKKHVRERIMEAYGRITSVPLLTVNAALAPSEVVEEAIRLLQKYM